MSGIESILFSRKNIKQRQKKLPKDVQYPMNFSNRLLSAAHTYLFRSVLPNNIYLHFKCRFTMFWNHTHSY